VHSGRDACLAAIAVFAVHRFSDSRSFFMAMQPQRDRSHRRRHRAQSFPRRDLSPVREAWIPEWARTRHQMKLDRAWYKQFLAEAGLSDESCDDSLSSLTSPSSHDENMQDHCVRNTILAVRCSCDQGTPSYIDPTRFGQVGFGRLTHVHKNVNAVMKSVRSEVAPHCTGQLDRPRPRHGGGLGRSAAP
jgi:hypothetical protein